MFACSGTNQVVGSDGLPVGAGTAGAGQGGPGSAGAAGHAGALVSGGNAADGNSTNGTAPAAELNYKQAQLNYRMPGDGHVLCLPEPLPVDPATGNAACYVVSARHETDCNCAAAGYSPASDELSQVTRRTMRLSGICSPSVDEGTARLACDEMCVCKVDPAVGSSLRTCQSEKEPDASTTGWCYVSEAGDTAQQALLEDCPSTQQQRLRFFGAVTEHPSPELRDFFVFLGCPVQRPVGKVGETCTSDLEYTANFSGFNVEEVNIEDHSPACETGVCIQNHFQGRVSCTYGQFDSGEECTVPGSNTSVNGPVAPQLVARAPHLASICSCQCAGSGPGPYCTCPTDMQCEPLVDDLHNGTPLAGSYCIPSGSQYDPQGDTTTCSRSSCVYNRDNE